MWFDLIFFFSDKMRNPFGGLEKFERLTLTGEKLRWTILDQKRNGTCVLLC